MPFIARNPFLPNVDFTNKGASSTWAIQHEKEHQKIVDQINQGTPVAVGGTDATAGFTGLNFTSADGTVTVTPSASPTTDKTNIDLSAATFTDSDLAQEGFVEFANGLKIQWGLETPLAVTSGTEYTVTWPKAFTTLCWSVVAVIFASQIDNGKWTVEVITRDKTQGSFRPMNNGSGTDAPSGWFWIAIGL